MSDAAMMATASVTAYVGGAVPPEDRRLSFVALPAPDYIARKLKERDKDAKTAKTSYR
jgi:hypothetical protein